MGLHDRLNRTDRRRPPTCTSRRSRTPSRSARHDPYAELKTRVHHEVIATLGAELFKQDANEDMSERVLRAVTEQLTLDRTPLTREERRQLVREITDDILGYGPLEPFLRDDSVTEVMVNAYDRIYVERARPARADAGGVRRQRAPAAHHRQDRLAGRPARRRVVADGRCPPPRRLACERDHPAARAARPDADDPEVRARPVHDERPDRLRHDHRQGGAVPSPRACAAS